MAWDVEYTLRMRERVERFGVRSIEEPLPPDDYHGYEVLGKHGSAVAIATGETAGISARIRLNGCSRIVGDVLQRYDSA